ncbi:hypothetical protein OF83DRAFT_1089081 [Amylostereum chailletii]|nr:hypothetical protein OF83DRAFT_1089081 [Amylostereum chailletii]
MALAEKDASLPKLKIVVLVYIYFITDRSALNHSLGPSAATLNNSHGKLIWADEILALWWDTAADGVLGGLLPNLRTPNLPADDSQGRRVGQEGERDGYKDVSCATRRELRLSRAAECLPRVLTEGGVSAMLVVVRGLSRLAVALDALALAYLHVLSSSSDDLCIEVTHSVNLVSWESMIMGVDEVDLLAYPGKDWDESDAEHIVYCIWVFEEELFDGILNLRTGARRGWNENSQACPKCVLELQWGTAGCGRRREGGVASVVGQSGLDGGGPAWQGVKNGPRRLLEVEVPLKAHKFDEGLRGLLVVPKGVVGHLRTISHGARALVQDQDVEDGSALLEHETKAENGRPRITPPPNCGQG